MSQANPGWVECVECDGKGCVECDNKGLVECEHAEFEHNCCLDCGYDQTDDLMDLAERERDRQVDIAIDRKKEERMIYRDDAYPPSEISGGTNIVETTD